GYPYAGTPTRPAFTYPFTPAGQRQCLIDLISAVKRTPMGLGRGVIYWEPEWLPRPGSRGGSGGNTTFDRNGNALPCMAALGGLLDPNTNYNLINVASGMALAARGGGSRKDELAVRPARSGDKTAIWRILSTGDGYLELQSLLGGRPLDAPANSAGVVLGSAGDGARQQWDIVSAGDGHFKLVNRASSEILTESGSVNAASLALGADSAEAQSEWRIVPQP
ncbi:MAG TPA: RICIN domain-containing protein, partial [Chthonomonadales bacterium]|nr:RICIN domain-containing protein [Chthonomonadales bacterium]